VPGFVTPVNASIFSNRWVIALIVTTVLFVAFLVGTPFLIKHFTKQWLTDNAGEQVRVKDVDFNPFTATLLLKELEVQTNSEITLAFQSAGLDMDWLPLFQRKISVRSVELTGFNIIIEQREQDTLSIGGIKLPSATPDSDTPPVESAGWLSAIDTLSLRDTHILYKDSKLQLDVVLDRLEMTRFTQWEPDRHAIIELSGTVNNAPLKLEGKLAPLASTPRYEVNLSISKIPLATFEKLANPDIQTLSGFISFDGNISVEQPGSVLHVKETGSISLDDLNVVVRQPALVVQNKTFTLTGDFSFDHSEAEQSIQLDSDIVITELGVGATGRKINLVNAETLNITDLVINELNNISVKEVVSEHLYLGRPLDSEPGGQGGDAFSHTEKLEITELAVADKLVSADSILFHGHQNHVVREADGSWTMLRLIDLIENINEPVDAEKPVVVAEQQPAEPQEAEPVDIAIKRIETSGNSAISLLDQSVKPPFAMTLDFEELSLDNVDTRQPDQQSPLKVEAKIGKHTRLSLNGGIQPFLKPLGMNLTGKIHAMDLPALSSYTRDSLGLVLDSGTLDADLAMESKAELLDGKVELKLHQLELKTVESENSLQSKIPVPLNVALDTLRDNNNSINLNIPIQGNANDPGFDVSDVLSVALAKGVKQGALSYLTLALQPYGTLITAAKYAGEAVTKVRLNPVEFEPGMSNLDQTDQDYLSKVAQVMKDRPKLAIKLCGVVAQTDQLYFQQQQVKEDPKKSKKTETGTPPVIDEQKLAELARQRAEIVKDHLVEQHQVPADHLVGCQPRIEINKEDSSPRVDILI